MEKDLLKLLLEAGIVLRTPKSGPYHIGLTNHLSSAAHSYRSMLLSYFHGTARRG